MVTVDEALIVGLAQEMVRAETVNPPGNERRLAEMLAARARSLGLEARVLPLEADRANLLVRLRGAGDRAPLVFTGHLDTVPPGPEPWGRPPFQGKLHDGRLHGRGACDMKGAVAALVGAAAALARARPGGLRGDLLLALTAGEEVDSCGARAFARGRDIPSPAGLLVAEPTNLALFTAERGVLWVEVLFRGKAAHGSSPHLGVNAILAATELLRRLETLSWDIPDHPLLGGPSLNVGTIAGGLATNIVPDRCAVTLDFRTLPGQDSAALLEGVRRILLEIGRQRPGIRTEARSLREGPAIETAADLPFVRLVQQAHRQVTGLPEGPEPQGARFFTDGAVLAPAWGCPMVILGPGDPALAHQTDEWVEVEQLMLAARIYATLADRMLGGAA